MQKSIIFVYVINKVHDYDKVWNRREDCRYAENGEVAIDMTLTAPNCPAADFIMEDVRQKVESIDGVPSAAINLVFEPEWDKDMMSEEAKLELGFL